MKYKLLSFLAVFSLVLITNFQSFSQASCLYTNGISVVTSQTTNASYQYKMIIFFINGASFGFDQKDGVAFKPTDLNYPYVYTKVPNNANELSADALPPFNYDYKVKLYLAYINSTKTIATTLTAPHACLKGFSTQTAIWLLDSLNPSKYTNFIVDSTYKFTYNNPSDLKRFSVCFDYNGSGVPNAAFTLSSGNTVSANVNDTIKFTGSAPLNATYIWNKGNSHWVSGDTTGPGPIVVYWDSNQLGAHNLTLKVKGVCYSSILATVPVTVTALVLRSVITPVGYTPHNDSITICQNTSVTLNANRGIGLTYQWKFNDGNIPNATNSSFNATSDGKYNLVVTLNANSLTSAPLNIAISPLPLPAITGTASVCLGATGNVYSTEPGMTAYTWAISSGGIFSGGTGNSSVTVTWNSVGQKTISVNYTNAYGCSAIAPYVYNVSVHALPVPTITGAASVCAGSTGNVYTTEAGMSGYTWNIPTGGTITDGAGTSSVTVIWNTVGAKTISVTYTDGNGCSASSPTVKNITVNAILPPTLTGPASVCIGSTGNVYTTEAGMTGYRWTVSGGGTIVGGANTNTITVTWNTLGAQTICVNYSNTYGCRALNPTCKTVTVHPLPVPTITGPNSVCNGSSGNVYTTEAGMTGYTWNLSVAGTIVGGFNTNTVTVTWAAAGTQSICVNYTDPNGCTATSSTCYNVTVKGLPNPALNGPTVACAGSTGNIYITDAGMADYSWIVSAGGTITSGAATSSITVTWNTAGAQSVSVNYSNGCSAALPKDLPVTVNALPIVYNVTGSNTSCIGGIGNHPGLDNSQIGVVYQLFINGYNLVASIPGTGAALSFGNQTATGAYTVVGTVNGCSNNMAGSAVINYYPLPIPTITGPASVCAGSTGNVYTTETGMTVYTWTVSAGGIIVGPTNINTVTVTWNTGGGTISVNYTNSNACTASTPTLKNVTVYPLPTANITPPGPVTIYTGQSVTFTANASVNASYQWMNNGNNIGNNNSTFVASDNGTYSVVLTDDNSCVNASSNSVEVIVRTDQFFSATAYAQPSVICSGESSTLNVIVSGGSGSYTYLWTPGDGTAATFIPPADLLALNVNPFSVKVTDTVNKKDTVVYTSVTVNPVPVAKLNHSADTAFCKGGSIELIAQNDNGDSFQWQFNYTDINNASLDSIAALKTGSYTVVVSNKGCFATSDAVSITVYPLPDVSIFPIGPDSIINGDSLMLNSNTSGNVALFKWRINNTDIPGASSYFIYAKDSGVYTLLVQDNHGCDSTSNSVIVVVRKPVSVINVSPADNDKNLDMNIYPNPSNGLLTVTVRGGRGNVKLSVLNMTGQSVYSKDYANSFTDALDFSSLAKGLYILKLENNSTSKYKKLVIK